MPTNLFSRLSRDFGELLESSFNHDVVIQVDEIPHVVEFHVHSIILATRSPYFRSALSDKWATKQNGLITFKKPNISSKIFKLILNYIYTGEINLENKDLSEILEFFIASDELLLDEILIYIQEYLLNNNDIWATKNSVKVLNMLFQYDSLLKLKDYYLKIICNNPKLLFESDDFITLKEDILIFIIKLDSLDIKEVDLWNHILHWGITQTPSFKDKELKMLLKKDFLTLQETLIDIIPLIRFFQMSGDDITNSVYPFRKILPKSLKNDIMYYFTASNYKPKSIVLPPRANKKYSTIISTRHVSLIEGWISHDSSNQINQQRSSRPCFSWNLLYRASEDGFNASDFHRKCDNKGACVVIVRIKDSDKIVGGYNPVGWMLPNGYTATDKSFLFYFDNSTSKISRILPDCSVSAIFQNSSYGPTFGYPDLFISSNCNQTNSDCNCNHYYEKKFSVNDFFVEDYEVFQIISRD